MRIEEPIQESTLKQKFDPDYLQRTPFVYETPYSQHGFDYILEHMPKDSQEFITYTEYAEKEGIDMGRFSDLEKGLVKRIDQAINTIKRRLESQKLTEEDYLEYVNEMKESFDTLRR